MKGNNGKKQISFRVPTEIAEEIKAAAVEQGFQKLGPFCRELFDWAWAKHKQAGALLFLKQPQLKVPRKK